MLTAGELLTAKTALPAVVRYEMDDGSWKPFVLTTELLHDTGCSRTTTLIDDLVGNAIGLPIIVCSCDVAILLDLGRQR